MNTENTSKTCGDCNYCSSSTGTVAIGKTLPDFEFEYYHKEEFKKARFSDYKGKWLAVVFYPADFTFVCPTELEDLAKLYPEFQKRNAEIVSFSTDTVFTHKAWHDTSEAIKQVGYPMGADPSGKIARYFGVRIDEHALDCLADEGLSLRGTFLIDPTGAVKTIEIHHNDVGRKAKETLRKLEAAQYVESHPGNVCPASWEEGDDTLEPGIGLVGKI